MKADHILEAASRVSEAAELMTLHTVSETASVSSPGGPIRTTLEESSCSIRIVRNGRIGSGASSGRTAGPDLIDQAIALSRIGPEALFSLPGPSEPEPLDTEHPLVLQTGLEDLTGFLIGVETELASRWPRSVVRGSISRRSVEVSVANTSGFEGSYRKSVLDLALAFTFAGRDGMTVRNSSFVTGLPLTDPARIVDGLLPCGPGVRRTGTPGGSVRAVLSPRVLSTLLQTIRSQAAGWTRDRGFSSFVEGQSLGSGLFTLHDRPRLPFGGASAPFDAEGVPTADRCLVENGVFLGHIHDLASAARCGTGSTGSAGRNPGEMPVPVCTNLAMEAGGSSLEDLLREAGEGLLILELLPGVYGNAAGGDFRIPVSSAFTLSGGEASAPLRTGCFMEGNALDLLRSIAAVGDTLYGVETDRLPHVLVEGITVR
ncbi:MAG TPA: TldD/PmbA family protein [Candidatus Fermentibacter daniensis]|nr:TldD/PmbA family protein [Candidatus Fermentibacter daniensis]